MLRLRVDKVSEHVSVSLAVRRGELATVVDAGIDGGAHGECRASQSVLAVDGVGAAVTCATWRRRRGAWLTSAVTDKLI